MLKYYWYYDIVDYDKDYKITLLIIGNSYVEILLLIK